MFTIASPRVEAPPVPLQPLPKIESVYLAGKPNTALRKVLHDCLNRIGRKITITDRFDRVLVSQHTCTVVIDGEDVDWSHQVITPGSHVLALSRDLQASTKPPLGLSFLRKPIKLKRFVQYLSSIQ